MRSRGATAAVDNAVPREPEAAWPNADAAIVCDEELVIVEETEMWLGRGGCLYRPDSRGVSIDLGYVIAVAVAFHVKTSDQLTTIPKYFNYNFKFNVIVIVL